MRPRYNRTRSRYPIGGICSSLLGIGALVSAAMLTLAARTASAQEQQISAGALQQIQAVMDEKASRTPAQRKVGSGLLLEMKRRRGDPLLLAVPTLRSSVEIAPDGTTLVDIKADVTDDLLRRIEDLGGVIINSHPRYNAIRARLPVDIVETLADSPDVRFIRPAAQAITNKINTFHGSAGNW